MDAKTIQLRERYDSFKDNMSPKDREFGDGMWTSFDSNDYECLNRRTMPGKERSQERCMIDLIDEYDDTEGLVTLTDVIETMQAYIDQNK